MNAMDDDDELERVTRTIVGSGHANELDLWRLRHFERKRLAAAQAEQRALETRQSIDAQISACVDPEIIAANEVLHSVNRELDDVQKTFDALERICESYEREMARLKKQLEDVKEDFRRLAREVYEQGKIFREYGIHMEVELAEMRGALQDRRGGEVMELPRDAWKGHANH